MTAPSYEQLAALMAAQERIIAELRARIVEQDLRTAELERQRDAKAGSPGRRVSFDASDARGASGVAERRPLN